MGIQILLNIQTMKTIIILTALGLCGSLTNACWSQESGNCCYGRMGSGLRIADGDDTIETFAYEICNRDGVDGLSWTEVEQCEELYCDDLPEITCPKKEDFEFFDMDGDGILTWSEWKSIHA